MKTFLVALVLGMSLASPSWASGGFFCQTHPSDKNAELFVSGGLSHSLPGAPFQVAGALNLKDKDWKMHEIANIDSLAQFWFEGGKLNLLVYREPEAGEEFLSSTLVIKTAYSKRKGMYFGSYELSLTRGESSKTLKGSITCEMD